MSAPRCATRRAFDGQRASVGRVVVLVARRLDGSRVDTALCAGMIAAIDEASDLPLILIAGAPTEDASTNWTFVATKTEADVEALAPYSWTWPVRVGGAP